MYLTKEVVQFIVEIQNTMSYSPDKAFVKSTPHVEFSLKEEVEQGNVYYVFTTRFLDRPEPDKNPLVRKFDNGPEAFLHFVTTYEYMKNRKYGKK